MVKYFKVIDIDTGDVVCEGKSSYVANHLDTDPSTVRKSAKTGLKIQHKYLAIEISAPKPNQVKKVHKETELEETERLLKIYGNTNLRKHREQICSQLEEKGYRLKIEKYGKTNTRYCKGVVSGTKDDWIVTWLDFGSSRVLEV